MRIIPSRKRGNKRGNGDFLKKYWKILVLFITCTFTFSIVITFQFNFNISFDATEIAMYIVTLLFIPLLFIFFWYFLKANISKQ